MQRAEPPKTGRVESASLTSLATIIRSLSNLTPQEHRQSENESYQTQRNYLGHGSPLSRLSTVDQDQSRSILLTLHVLFPHELLPALDLLDRRAVTKLTVDSSPVSTDLSTRRIDKFGTADDETLDENAALKDGQSIEVFYVQSASTSAVDQSNSSRYRSQNAKSVPPSTSYEVRLDSWNCSCPAFTVSGFQCLSPSTPSGSVATQVPGLGPHSSDEQSWQTEVWRFGGVATRQGCRAPICKHMLAAIITKTAPELFKDGFTERPVTRDEIAAWGGGWSALGAE